MHLFTLLFAAAFASNFVAPNQATQIKSTDPATIGELDFILDLEALSAVVDLEPSLAEITWKLGSTNVYDDAEVTLTVNTDSNDATIVFDDPIELTNLLGDNGEIPEKVWIFVNEAAAGSRRTSNEAISKEIAVVSAAEFTVNEEEPVALTDPKLMPALTIETDDDYRWGAIEKVCLSVGAKKVYVNIETDGEPGQETYGTNEANIEDLELDIDHLVDVTVSLVLVEAVPDTSPEVLYPHTATVALVKKAADFTVTPTPLTPDDLIEGKALTIVGPAAPNDWDATGDINVTFSATRIDPATAAPTAVFNAPAPETGVNWAVTADLSGLAAVLTAASTRVFVYVQVEETWLEVPYELRYDGVDDPVGTFTIAPATWAYEVLAAQSVKLVFTDTSAEEPTPTGWATTMKAQFKFGNEVKTADVTRKGEEAPYTGEITTVDLSELGVPTTGGTIKVSLSPANTVKFIEPAVDLVISPKVEVLEFSFTPGKIEEAKLETEIDISAAPVTEGAWDEVAAVKVIFTLTNEKPNTEPAGLTFALNKPDAANAPVPWPGKATLTALVVPEGQESVWVWAKVDGTVLPVGKEVDYEAGEDPEPEALFTVDPTTIDLRTTTKATITVQQKEQTEETAWEEKVFLYFSLTEGEPDEDTLVKPAVLKDGTTDTWTVAELTLAEIEGIAKDKTVYVYLEHGAEEGLDGTIEEEPATIAITQSAEPEEPEAAMGVSPLLSLLAALVFLFVKLF